MLFYGQTIFDCLLWGGGLFFVSLCVQIAIWNTFLIKAEVVGLIIVYFLLPLTAIVVFSSVFNLKVFDALLAGLVHTSLSSALIMTYPTLKSDIPSIIILKEIKANNAMSLAQLSLSLEDHPIFNQQRLKDLENDNFVEICDRSVKLTRKGKLLADFFILYRRLLGSTKPQG